VTSKPQNSRLHVVPKASRKELDPKDFHAPIKGTQSNLFPAPRPGMIIFVYFPDVTEDEFRKALELSKPCAVFELRNTPRFDIGKLNRRAVFQYFDSERIRYVDITSWTHRSDSESSIFDDVAQALQTECVRFDRPVMFLMNTHNAPSGFSRRIVDLVSSVKKISPEVLSIPQFVAG
jgi:hypothetical protein